MDFKVYLIVEVPIIEKKFELLEIIKLVVKFYPVYIWSVSITDFFFWIKIL